MELRLRDLNYKIGQNTQTLPPLLQFIPGLYLLWGVSGSGKTSFLQAVSGRQSGLQGMATIQGRVYFLDRQKDCDEYFARHCSFHQHESHVLEELNVEENILLPSRLCHKSPVEDWRSLIHPFGLESVLNNPSLSLSRGEKQRVSIVRALVFAHEILLLDEPFVHLQEDLKARLLNTLVGHVLQRNLICLISTHDPRILEGVSWLGRVLFEKGFSRFF